MSVERRRSRIHQVGLAYYAEGRPVLSGWMVEGGPFGVNMGAVGADDPALGGWTFRELHAIANGSGPDVEPVRDA